MIGHFQMYLLGSSLVIWCNMIMDIRYITIVFLDIHWITIFYNLQMYSRKPAFKGNRFSWFEPGIATSASTTHVCSDLGSFRVPMWPMWQVPGVWKGALKFSGEIILSNTFLWTQLGHWGASDDPMTITFRMPESLSFSLPGLRISVPWSHSRCTTCCKSIQMQLSNRSR